MGNPAARKEKATPSDIRRRDNEEQWAKPLRRPIVLPMSKVDMGNGHEP
jgi:hypothetical protein